MSKFTVKIYETSNGDVQVFIVNAGNKQSIKLIVGKDGYLWGGTPNGSGYAPSNIEKYLSQTLEDWSK